MQNQNNKPPNTVTLWPLPDTRHIYLLAAGIVLGVLLGPAVMGRVLPKQYEQWFNLGGGYDIALAQAKEKAQDMQNDPGAWILAPQVEQDIQQYEALAYQAMDDRLQSLQDTGVTQQAITEHREQSEHDIITYRAQVTQREYDAKLEHKHLHIGMLDREQSIARHEHILKLIGIQMALVLALIAFAIAEALLAPQPDSEGRRVISPRLAHMITIRYALLAGWLVLTLAQPAALQTISPVFSGVLVAVVLVVGLIPLGKPAGNVTA